MRDGETVGHYPATRWIAMAILLLAGFMNLMDVTIVNVALPTMRESLGATSAEIEWVVAAYTLAFALGLLPFGRLGDRFGRRRMFLWGVAAFSLCSLLCGMAPDMTTLIAARLLQGFSAAMMAPQTLAIAQVIFPPQERGAAFALFGMAASLAAVSGPIIGGLLIAADIGGLDWRPIFLVNAPIGALAIAAALRFIPPTSGYPGTGVDFGGMALAAVALFLLLFPLIEGRGYGWPLWCFAMLAAAPIAGWAFIAWQYRQARSGRPQLMPVSVLGDRGFLSGMAISTLFFSGIAGMFLCMAVFLQSGHGLTPLQSGLTNTPFSVGILIGSIISGRLGAGSVRWRVFGGALAMALAIVWLGLVIRGTGEPFSSLPLLAPLLIAGTGMGTAIAPLYQAALAGIVGRDAGSASGSIQSIQQAGSALGLAVMAEIFFRLLEPGLASGGTPHPVYNASMQTALWYQVAVFAIVAFGAWTLREPPAPARAAAAA